MNRKSIMHHCARNGLRSLKNKTRPARRVKPGRARRAGPGFTRSGRVLPTTNLYAYWFQQSIRLLVNESTRRLVTKRSENLSNEIELILKITKNICNILLETGCCESTFRK